MKITVRMINDDSAVDNSTSYIEGDKVSYTKAFKFASSVFLTTLAQCTKNSFYSAQKLNKPYSKTIQMLDGDKLIRSIKVESWS